MKVADDQLFKQENCTKREEFNALRIVIPSLRIDTEKESKPPLFTFNVFCLPCLSLFLI